MSDPLIGQIVDLSKAYQVRRTPKATRFSRKAKRDADEVFTFARAWVRLKTWQRAGCRCQRCGTPLPADEADRFAAPVSAHIHETVKRSQEGSPLDLANTECLCGECHLQGEHGQ